MSPSSALRVMGCHSGYPASEILGGHIWRLPAYIDIATGGRPRRIEGGFELHHAKYPSLLFKVTLG